MFLQAIGWRNLLKQQCLAKLHRRPTMENMQQAVVLVDSIRTSRTKYNDELVWLISKDGSFSCFKESWLRIQKTNGSIFEGDLVLVEFKTSNGFRNFSNAIPLDLNFQNLSFCLDFLMHEKKHMFNKLVSPRPKDNASSSFGSNSFDSNSFESKLGTSQND